jgi:hypothetical protein
VDVADALKDELVKNEKLERELALINETLSSVERASDPTVPKRIGRMNQEMFHLYAIGVYAGRLQFIQDKLRQLIAARETL